MDLASQKKIKRKSKMVVTQIEPLTKTKWKVYIDGKFAFVESQIAGVTSFKSDG